MRFFKKGYFLIEISISVLLILIITTIAIPNFNFLYQQFLLSDLEKLNMAFVYMQQLAITKNKNLTLNFENSQTYFYENFKEKLSKNVIFGVLPGIQGPPSSANHIVTNPISFIENKVIFYNNGQIQPGTVYLTDNINQYALTVPVSQVSYIRKYKFTNRKWIAI